MFLIVSNRHDSSKHDQNITADNKDHNIEDRHVENVVILKPDTGKLLFYAAVFMRNMLAEQVHLAQTDLLTAAADKPMYGVLHVIRLGLINQQVNAV